MRDSVNAHGLLGGAAVGVAATVTMDLVMVAAAKAAPGAFASKKNSPEAIGRWAAGLCRGCWRSEDMSAEPPVRGELWLGLAAHYLTGVVLTEVYLTARAPKRAAAGRRRRRCVRDGDRRPAAHADVSVHGVRLLRTAERRRAAPRGLDAPGARGVRRRHRPLGGGYQTNGMKRRRTCRR